MPGDRRARLSGALLVKSDFSACVLSGADLAGARLRRADWAGCDLSGAVLTGADWSFAKVADCDLRGAELSGVDLSSAKLGRVRLAGATGWPAALDGLQATVFDERDRPVEVGPADFLAGLDAGRWR